jgi:hypothetical protein
MSDSVLVRARFDPSSDRSVSVTIAEAVALVAESALDLPPLAHTIDTDSLDALFTTGGDTTGTTPPSELRLTFPYLQWQVTVTGAGEIVIGARSGREAPSG